GVVAAFAGSDFEWAGPLLMAWPVTEGLHNPLHYPLVPAKARSQGDAVAGLVARSRAIAEDAVEAVKVDYEPLPAVVDMHEALSDDSTFVHDEFGTNQSYTWAKVRGEVDTVFEDAPVVVKERYKVHRLIPNAMEPRSILVQPNPAAQQFTMGSPTKLPP